MQKHGSKNIVYFDESGFAMDTPRHMDGLSVGLRYLVILLVTTMTVPIWLMAQRGKEWLARCYLKVVAIRVWSKLWLEQMLLPELTGLSLIIMDNASFHDKAVITELLKANGHRLMLLPPYSPDFNPIEQSFAIIKKRRIYNKVILDKILTGNLNLK